jgi:hypothetical protein
MKSELFALALAGTVMVPHATPALSSEPTRPAPSASASWTGWPLPPVPYLDTMPWLASGSIWTAPQVDSTWRPDLKAIGPFEPQATRPGSFSQTLTRMGTPTNG